ncbi:MAG: D-2-hydroxyacid dehydrogenase [Bacteroidales bacterium]|nr:D-2-hydroxyacid dehydrogenase [Bacteroidales bacterium]MBQ9722044.1 D-2-hydroxyacid dehydrogenase [Bacteroidales bacterium]
MKIVFLDAATMGDVSFEPFERLGEFVSYPTSTPEQARERVADADVVMINKVLVNKELIDAAPALKLVCVAATGVNNIDVEYAASKGIPVRNVAGYSTDSVAQSTFMHILSLAGGAPYFDESVKSGSYSRSGMFTDPNWNWTELAGKTIGIIGMGNIGRKVAAIAQAFGMEVCYYSTSGTAHCKDYPCLPLDELLKVSDIVSVHAPLNERTLNLLGAREFAMMKPTAYVVNAGRGAIIVEKDLADAVDNGVIAGAGIDVFVQEPIPEDHPYLKMKHPERMRLAPHVAWASVEARKRLVAMMADNVRKGW